jgi:hypothetical protein
MIVRAFQSQIISLLIFAFILLPSCTMAVDKSVNPEIAVNDKTVYELPDGGTILPNNPLFQLKKIRDDVFLLFMTGQIRAKNLIALSDRYTVYAQKMITANRPQTAFELFENSVDYQRELVKHFKNHEARTDATTGEDMCYKAIQSNIKQSEVIKSILSDVSPTDQNVLAQILEMNLEVRKMLENCMR